MLDLEASTEPIDNRVTYYFYLYKWVGEYLTEKHQIAGEATSVLSFLAIL